MAENFKSEKRDDEARALNKNSVSIAGEYAVLSQLAARGYDANMTLGRTKGVDILVSDPNSGRMLKLEVKTNRGGLYGRNTRLFGKYLCAWIMAEKHERIRDENLFYCFINISEDTNQFRFFIIPSHIVADYVITEHKAWLNDKETRRSDNKIRTFRIGDRNETYPFPTPFAQDYEDNWTFQS
ncbi:MAG TPA: hypothetical protein VN975_05090 [Xanthobacteraceae bacterium]|jgi:hypothetical protein|nr:hypothetical protein [Xanthobacteraceae bacterium]